MNKDTRSEYQANQLLLIGRKEKESETCYKFGEFQLKPPVQPVWVQIVRFLLGR